MHFPDFLLVLAVIFVPFCARTANRTAQEAFEVMSYSGYGHGLGNQTGGLYYDMNPAMDTVGEGFNTTDFSTTNDGDDHETCKQSSFYMETSTYQDLPPLTAEHELPGSHNEGTFQAHGSNATTYDCMDTASFTVSQFLARQGSWSQVAPSRQNTQPKDTREWDNLLGGQTLNMELQDYSNNLTHGDNSTAPLDHSFASQDSTSPNFVMDYQATEAFWEPVPGLQAQPGGQLHYPSHLDLGSDTINPDAMFPGGQPTTATAAGPPHKCEVCAKAWETRTQLKKCIDRHVKPYLCPVIGCGKNEDGFATLSDVDRHCDSVHQQDLSGNPRPPRPCLVHNCLRTFPQTRNDNHKQHLKKVHRLSAYSADNLLAGLSPSGRNKHYRSYCAAEPHGIEDYSAPHVQQGVGIALPSDVESLQSQSQRFEVGNRDYEYQSQAMQVSMDNATYQWVPLSEASPIPAGLVDPLPRNDFQPRMDLSMNIRTQGTNSCPSSSQGEASKLSEEDTVVTSAFCPMPSPCKKMTMQRRCQKSPTNPRRPAQELTQGLLEDARSQKSKSFSHTTSADISSRPSLQRYQTVPESHYPSLPDSYKGFGQTRDELKAARLVQASEFVEKESYCATSAQSNMSSPAASSANHDPESCGTCYKYRDFPCQLKKHLKREAKPYPCIRDNCTKRSGSKSDQMRHDNSKHVNFERWRCNLLRDHGTRCGSDDFNHPASFEKHLTSHHGLRVADAKGLVGKGRIVNKDYPDEFWCGFCGYRVRCMGDPKARRELFFTHVEDHLQARDGAQTAEASDWRPMPRDIPLPVEVVLRKKTTTNQASSPSATRVESQMPVPSRDTSFRSTATARLQPSQAPSSSDASNKRHPSKSPLLRPRGGAKRLKSDDELRHRSDERGDCGTRSRRSTIVTISCCSCSNFGNEMTGLCDCGHEYGSCCVKQYVRQHEQEFEARIRDDQRREGYGSGRGSSSYAPFDSRSFG